MVTVSCKKVKTGSDYVCFCKKVDNLIATIDLNGKQIDGATDEVLPMGSIRAKFEALTGMFLTSKKETTSKLL
jgi:transketolase N-terminal domain/subunit